LGTLTLIEYTLLAPALSTRVAVNVEDVYRRLISVGEKVRMSADFDTKEGKLKLRVTV
jgi:hypothetical protein